ncbi:tRNA epoxyqueuosine(34) reductase QueG [Aliiruegeria lutimaris]|uniref:Epoxyqueuosine reductase n=1 Tax=Aliiruegeria lutimaris TaxID=571298 RepID=A0A1G8R9V0_9RHOB|nr:tRNA epoxyqueuosine(34) reductase QueG [Aliiruegeria lutimaris]SDJ13160.1 epoxyqueuosine reductase [Aliiruegeria lutimaris]
MTRLRDRLERQAVAEGFSLMRICRPDAIAHVPGELAEFVERGFHGQMDWMTERMAWRGDPSALWPEARSIILLAESYSPEEDPEANIANPELATVSVYARGKDYHDLVKKRLKRLARWLIAEGGGEVKVFVDTAPVAEKPLGQAAGLGWQGKHTNLVSRDLGNWFFIGSVFSTLELEPDEPEQDHCGSCRACLDACPTEAFVAPYRMDARRCISYLTIEHHGPVDPELRARMGNRIYGCDACLAACPWNKFAVEASDLRYAARGDLAAPPLAELAQLDDSAFRARFSGSPIKRIGRNRFVRNVLYAIGNSGQPGFRAIVENLCEDPDSTVADAANWALSRLPGVS